MTTSANDKRELLRTLPNDDVRYIMWRLSDRYELQMLVQSVRAVARGPVAKAVAETDIIFMSNCPAVLGVEKKVLDGGMAKNKPVIVAITPLVQAGAFAGIQSDWKRAGEMCAEKADKIIRGTPANRIPIEFPDIYKIVINVKVAEQLGISVPYKILELASEVIE